MFFRPRNLLAGQQRDCPDVVSASEWQALPVSVRMHLVAVDLDQVVRLRPGVEGFRIVAGIFDGCGHIAVDHIDQMVVLRIPAAVAFRRGLIV